MRSPLLDRRSFLRMAGAAWLATLEARPAFALSRADARSHAPQTGARSYATPPRELQPWLALLIALLFALERLLATQVRRGAPA